MMMKLVSGVNVPFVASIIMFIIIIWAEVYGIFAKECLLGDCVGVI